jgi:hypothetical protein
MSLGSIHSSGVKRDKGTERQKNRETERQRDRETGW